MRLLLLAVVLCGIGVMRVLAGGVAIGMERSDVEAAMGKPSAVLQRGDRQVLVYPQNGRVELAKGRVVEMANVPLSDEAVGSLETPTAPQTAASEPAKAGDNDINDAPATTNSPPISAQTHSATDHDSEDHEEEPASLPILALLIVAACRTAIMIVVLKLSFKWADVHADWLQMIAPALSDTVVRIAIILVAEKAFGTTDLFYADEALAYLALIFVLMKTTHACTLTRAIGVAAAAKLVSIVVGSLIVALVLNLLAG